MIIKPCYRKYDPRIDTLLVALIGKANIEKAKKDYPQFDFDSEVK